MSDKKVISIRFCTESKEDMKLYARLEQEAGSSASLASVVKARIEGSYNRQELMNRSTELQEKIVEAVREEIQKSGLKVIGTLLSNMDGVNMVQSIIPSTLPEKSETLPRGVLNFLE